MKKNAIIKEVLKVKLTLLDEMLGTKPNNADIYTDFIASKAPDALTRAEEIAMHGASDVADKGITVFTRDEDDNPLMEAYMVKGFFKESCSMLQRAAGKGADGKRNAVNESSKLKAYKKEIDGLIVVEPKYIKLQTDEVPGYCQRSLRAQTAQGERISLACSETVPAGTTLEFEIGMLRADLKDAVLEWLDYGEYHGLGQWRNADKGRFTYEVIK